MNSSSLLFNFNDVILLLTILLCVIFAILEATLSSKFQKRNLLFLALIFASTFLPLHKLILFGEYVRPWMIENYLNGFYIFSLGHWIEPPLLYLYTLVFLSPEPKIHKRHLIHLVLPLAYLVYLFVFYFQQPSHEKIRMVEGVNIPGIAAVIILGKIVAFAYFFFAFDNIRKHGQSMYENFASVSRRDLYWLYSLVVIYCIRAFSVMIAAFFHKFFPSFDLALFAQYSSCLQLITVCLMVYCRFHYLPTLETIHASTVATTPSETSHAPEIENEQELVERSTYLNQYMEKHKPHLNTGITLNRLSEQTGIAPRTLSATINRAFNVNFFEFINGFRVEEAKRLLTEFSAKEKSITNVYLEAGFNSRSVFNKFFLQHTGSTPSAYRKKHFYASAKSTPSQTNETTPS